MHALIALIESSRYGILFFGTFLGSPLVIVAAGYLVHIHQLDLVPAYATVVCADIIGDVGWYWVGRVGARPFLLRYGHYFGITPELVARLEARFFQYHERILIFSKLTMGLGAALAVLAVAGMVRIPFWRYLAINISGELLWALIPLAIGFYFGNVSDFVPLSVRWAFVLGGFTLGVLVMRHVLRKLAAREW